MRQAKRKTSWHSGSRQMEKTSGKKEGKGRDGQRERKKKKREEERVHVGGKCKCL